MCIWNLKIVWSMKTSEYFHSYTRYGGQSGRRSVGTLETFNPQRLRERSGVRTSSILWYWHQRKPMWWRGINDEYKMFFKYSGGNTTAKLHQYSRWEVEALLKLIAAAQRGNFSASITQFQYKWKLNVLTDFICSVLTEEGQVDLLLLLDMSGLSSLQKHPNY